MADHAGGVDREAVVYQTLKGTCVVCRQGFTLTPADQRWFLRRNLDLSRRCRPCRDQRKLAKAERAGIQEQSD